MDPRQRADPAFYRLHIGFDAFAAREPDDRLSQRQRILGAVIDFAGKQALPLLGPLALGDIDGDAADADDAAGLVEVAAAVPNSQRISPSGRHDTKFGLVGFDALVELGHRLAQFVDVVGMEQGLHILRIDLEGLRIDPEYPELPFVPHPVAVDPVPVPGAHAPAANARLRRCSLSSRRALECSSSLVRARTRSSKLGVKPLELPGLAIEFGKDADLGAQHLRHDRYRHVIDRPHFVSAQTIQIGDLNG